MHFIDTFIITSTKNEFNGKNPLLAKNIFNKKKIIFAKIKLTHNQ